MYTLFLGRFKFLTSFLKYTYCVFLIKVNNAVLNSFCFNILYNCFNNQILNYNYFILIHTKINSTKNLKISLKMEMNADRYLHKKFKKQLNVDSNTFIQNQEKRDASRIPISDSLQISHSSNLVITKDATLIPGLFSKSNDTVSVISSNNDVPKFSTNNENIKINAVASCNVVKSSISHFNVTNVERRENSVNVLITSTEGYVDPQSSNTCISYVISKPSRVENRNQPEAHFRTANFDTRFNMSEPIGIPTVGTSSILDNVYTEPYVTSKLVHVDKIEDISSNFSIVNNDHLSYQEGSCSILDNRNLETNYSTDFALVEKGSGGKYICSYCNLACSKPSVLQKHIRAHTNERPYPCVSCGFSFKTRSNLYKHCRSRTHANRVMGNKVQEMNNDVETESSSKLEPHHSSEILNEDSSNSKSRDDISEDVNLNNEGLSQDLKVKPYKPRFHNSKVFFDSISKDQLKKLEDQKVPETVQNRPSSSDLLSLHINEVINKNNAIVNTNEPYLLRKRSIDNSHLDNMTNNNAMHRYNEVINPISPRQIQEEKSSEEPLNLTHQSRKRCVSEIIEPTIHKSLIKELLLKNLYADSMQCPHCKMIFQTVTELELHKIRNCKGYTKAGARYNRSSSVNVASILTKNKNAFDSISYLQSSTFPLKSPGPFLGTTRLVESDKTKSFSFDDSFTKFQSTLHNPNILRSPLRYSLSPLCFESDKIKKAPVKLFGGEVKITQTTGTTSFNIDNKDREKCSSDQFLEHGERLSENRVVKSSLQSGGTVLQNKANFNNKQDSLGSPTDVIRMYDTSELPSTIDVSFDKSKFTYSTLQNQESNDHTSNSELTRSSSESFLNTDFSNVVSTSYKYTNIMDFSQRAVKLLAPNLKQPNLTIPGVPMPVPPKIIIPHSPIVPVDMNNPEMPKLSVTLTQVDNEAINMTSSINNLGGSIDSLQSYKQIHLPKNDFKDQTTLHIPNTVCNPVNLLVNGKVVRYVPGMPGPVAAEVPLNVAYGSNSISSPIRSHTSHISVKEAVKSPITLESNSHQRTSDNTNRINQAEFEKKSTNLRGDICKLPEVKITAKSPLLKNDIKLPNRSSPSVAVTETPKRFARPNTLALKPSISAQKQHHGLTPTMFNQILISPDTPRIAKKYMQHFLHGNYFSYLGLKSSTKSVYCTLNKTQPFYVPHFKKLSMYSEWRQQDIKGDKLYVSAYDSRQRQRRYVTSGKANADLVVHSSYKFTNEAVTKRDEHHKTNSILGGYESNEDYTYVRGRGRGRYVCDQCGIRCKKPSMLKKHIKTHTNDRPFTCNHCNFSFKTKGNLTKHMKSKAHTKNYAASSSSNSSAHQSGTQSSDSDTDDSGMDSSDESTRQQEHEAAYGLLSLSQKTPPNVSTTSNAESSCGNPNSLCSLNINPIESSSSFMNAEQITQVNNKNFAKNKILDQQISLNFSPSKIILEVPMSNDSTSKDIQNFNTFFGKCNNSNRPLTYPYTSEIIEENLPSKSMAPTHSLVYLSNLDSPSTFSEPRKELQNTSAFSIVQKHNVHYSPPGDSLSKTSETKSITIPITISYDSSYLDQYKMHDVVPVISQHQSILPRSIPSVKLNDKIISSYESVPTDVRKRKVQELELQHNNPKIMKINTESEAIDLSMPSLMERCPTPNNFSVNGVLCSKAINHYSVIESNNKVNVVESVVKTIVRRPEYKNLESANLSSNINHTNDRIQLPYDMKDENSKQSKPVCDSSEELEYSEESDNAINLKMSPKTKIDDSININYVIQESNASVITAYTELPNAFTPMDYDNSAMETLADVATKQVKLEKNTLAKSVASEYLKLATKHEFQSIEGSADSNFVTSNKEVSDLIVKPEENRNCTICSKSFSKPSQLRLHMNIHYLERPFRCDPCSVSFRTKGHFQKHERSAGHHNKLSSSPMFSSSEPRPFKCSDCKVAFRIHGHLAKHLRSKLHIMKLECLAKIPFGLYAELERANSLLTEINTTDGDQCLESLKALARKVFMNDPSKLNQLEVSLNNVDSSNS